MLGHKSAYTEHRFVPNKVIGDELVGNCPFCGKTDHFYVNATTLLFVCHRCGLAGSRFEYMEYVYDLLYTKETQDIHLEFLKVDKGLPVPALKLLGVMYDTENRQYIFPNYDSQTNKICDLRRYRLGQKTISTTGGITSLFNIRQLIGSANSTAPIFICAGESDTICLNWLFNINQFQAICVGLPGEGTFKKEWFSFFLKKDVVSCLDNDDKGDSSAIKLRDKFIGRICNSLQFINWPRSLPKGFDVRDFILSNTGPNMEPIFDKHVQDNLFSLIKPYHRNDTDQQKTTTNGTPVSLAPAILPQAIQYNISKTPSLEEVITCFEDYMDLTPELRLAIPLILSGVIGLQIPGDNPIWLLLVGPPACGKTSLLTTLSKQKDCYFQSNLTKTSLISGMSLQNGFDPSILAKIDKKCFVLKDLTEVLSKPAMERDEVFGILRGAYDGTVERDYGNGMVRKYICNFSFLAGVTNEIFAHSTAGLGERFLKFVVGSPGLPSEIQQDMAMDASLHGHKDQQKTQAIVNAFLNQSFLPPSGNWKGIIPDWFRLKLKILARVCAVLRTPVQRFQFGRMQYQPQYKPQFETGNRLAVQLQRLTLALCRIFKSDADEQILAIIKKVCVDTMHGYQFDIFNFLSQSNHGQGTQRKDIIAQMHLEQSTVDSYLQDLMTLHVIDKIEYTTPTQKGAGNGKFSLPDILGTKQWLYRIKPEILELWKQI